jgi:hypothetical protein
VGELHQKLKRAKEIRCECVDKVTESPERRAQKTLKGIQTGEKIELDNWDLICFSVLFLSSQLAVIPDLHDEVKSLTLKLMNAHYFQGGEFGLYNGEAVSAMTKAEFQKDREKDKTGEKIELDNG